MATEAAIEQQQQQQECVNPDNTKMTGATTCPSVTTETTEAAPTTETTSYVRDSPLHEALVNDTWRALEGFKEDDTSTSNRPRYFEGWYYKIDLPDEGGTFVVIPGLYLRKEEQHGFVMILDATTGHEPKCYFFNNFPIENVTSSIDGDHDFVFQLNSDNIFTAHNFTINLPASSSADGVNNPAVIGSAYWGPPLPLPATRINPTIMGWFSWLPRGFMQCSHGVVSMDHTITNGQVQIMYNGGAEAEAEGQDKSTTTTTKVINLTQSQGYIEKDWGREFPQKYTWIQASDFYTYSSNTDQTTTKKTPGVSFLVSVASIPLKPFENWLQFTGFLSFLRFPNPEDGGKTFQTIRMATYTGAKATYLYNITKNASTGVREHQVIVQLLSSKYNLMVSVTGDRDNAATLWGPLPQNPSGGMKPYVREMLNCPVHITLYDRKDNNKIVFEGMALHGGFEIEGHHDHDDSDHHDSDQEEEGTAQHN